MPTMVRNVVSIAHICACDHLGMPEMPIEDFQVLCDEILMPRLEKLLHRHLREVHGLVELSATGVKGLYDRLDELEKRVVDGRRDITKGGPGGN